MSNPSTTSETAQLGLWDAVSVIVGIVVGVAIFKTPAQIFGHVSGPALGLAAWVLGGLLALIGALCYAELATTYPRLGGDYVYLTRAFGRLPGFLFGWGHLSVVNTANMGAMAYVFADYANGMWFPGQGLETARETSSAASAAVGVWLALGAVAALSAFNLCGLVFGKAVQNILTIAKVLGLGLLILAGLIWSGAAPQVLRTPTGESAFGSAMIFVLYAYGGWNDSAFVAAEVRNRRRNMPRALILGTLLVTLIYLLVNLVYLRVLGFETLSVHPTPATAVLQVLLGDSASRGMGLLVMISALGALNGLIYTGSRVHASLGADHTLFAALGRWHPKLHSPVWSLLVQATIAGLMILAVGTASGRRGIDVALGLPGLGPVPWLHYGVGFDTLIAASAPVFWAFFLLTGLSLFVLRVKDRGRERPFRVPLYPVIPSIFCMMCAYMLYSSVRYAGFLALLGLGPLLVGLPLYFVSRRLDGRKCEGSMSDIEG